MRSKNYRSRHGHVLSTSTGSVTGNARGFTPYQRGASGLTRPDKDDTYVLNGETHRFDGSCHDECENVR